MASERLPGKVLTEFAGKPALCHLIDRVAATHHVELGSIVVCTTDLAEDSQIVDVAKSNGVASVRGDPNDIVARFQLAMNEFSDLDLVVQVNGDNPLTEPDYMDAAIQLILDRKADSVTCDGLPIGIGCSAFSRDALERVSAAYRTESNDTGFIYYFSRSGLCHHVTQEPLKAAHVLPEARLTLDYPEDRHLLEEIFNALYRPGEVFHLDEALDFLRQNPELLLTNNHLTATYMERTRSKVRLEFEDGYGVIQTITSQ